MLSFNLEYNVLEDCNVHIKLPDTIQPGKHRIFLTVDQDTQCEKLNPAEIFFESGFIGCAEAEFSLSENYKTKLLKLLKEKHDNS